MAGVLLVTRFLDPNGYEQGKAESFDSIAPGKILNSLKIR